MKHFLNGIVDGRSVVQSFSRSVVQSFSRSVVQSFSRSVNSFRFVVVSFFLCLSVLTRGQNDWVLYDLIPEELALAEKAMKQVGSKPNYTYLLIHGSGEQFMIYNTNANGFQAMTPVNLAEWVHAKKITSNIILLSGTNAKAAQTLADALGKADQLAQRPKRHVINWAEEVVLYENGHIKGNGKCYRHEFGVKPKELTGTDIPSGNKYDDNASDFLVTNPNDGPNVLLEWLTEYETATSTNEEKAQIKRWKRAASKYKIRQPVLYYALTKQNNKECFEGWYHLKELNYEDSDLGANLVFLCEVAQISRRYTKNTAHGTNMAKFRTVFASYLKNCKYKSATIQELSSEGLSLSDFETLVTQANKDVSLQIFLGKLTPQPTTILEKKWALLRETEKNLVDQLTQSQQSPLPKPLFDLLYKLIDDAPYDVQQEATITARKYRSNLTTPINLKIGKGEGLDKGLTFQNLLDITAMNTGTIQQQGSRGSIFETWVREAWAKRNLFDVKQTPAPTNIGKLTFPFASAGVPIAAATTTSYNRIIDCGYIEKNTPKEAEAKKCEIVGVELKHTTGKLSGEPFQQLKDNAALVAANKLRRIEYLFSTKKAAEDNLPLFRNNFLKLSDLKVSYIDENGIKKELKL